MLILIRHGQSTANAEGLLVGRLDVPLTEMGRAQASALDGALVGVEDVLSSPLLRARDTAALAVPNLSAGEEPAFIEQDFGLYDGHKDADVPRDEWRAFQESHTHRFGGGESLADVDERVHARLEEWRQDADHLIHDPHRHLVVVSHVSPIKSAVAWALGVGGHVAWRLRLENASVTTMSVRGSSPFLVTYNDVSLRTRTLPSPE